MLSRACKNKAGIIALLNFHTQKNNYKLPIEDAIRGLKILKDYGVKKINFAGGEPFTAPSYLGELIRQCKEVIKIDKILINILFLYA